MGNYDLLTMLIFFKKQNAEMYRACRITNPQSIIGISDIF